MKVPPKGFHLNGHTAGFHLKVRPIVQHSITHSQSGKCSQSSIILDTIFEKVYFLNHLKPEEKGNKITFLKINCGKVVFLFNPGHLNGGKRQNL